MRSAIKDSLSGILKDLKVTEPKQTETVARWKISGVSDAGSDIHLTVEVSRRGVPFNHVKSVSFFGHEMGIKAQSVIVDSYDEEAISATKIAALISDNRVAPRDVYDLHLLFSMNIKPAHDLVKTLVEKSGMSCTEIIQKAWDKIDLMTWDMFRQEVIPFLPYGVSSRINEEEYEKMRIAVGDSIESTLEEYEEAGMLM